MKIRLRETISPINVFPGDTITLTYTDEDGRYRELSRDTIDRAIVVDETIIFDLDETEMETLGVEDAIGGLFAKKRRTP